MQGGLVSRGLMFLYSDVTVQLCSSDPTELRGDVSGHHVRCIQVCAVLGVDTDAARYTQHLSANISVRLTHSASRFAECKVETRAPPCSIPWPLFITQITKPRVPST